MVLMLPRHQKDIEGLNETTYHDVQTKAAQDRLGRKNRTS